MRAAIGPVNIDPAVDKNFRTIREVINGNVALDNINSTTISGTTASEPDTQKLIQHSMNPPPACWFPITGDVYVQEISDSYVDVRSSKPGVNFTIRLFAGGREVASNVTATGDDTYQTTKEVIQNTPIVITNETEVNPIFISTTVAEAPRNSTSYAYDFNNVITDGNYFYCTADAETAAEDAVYQINRETGAVKAIDVGTSIVLSALYLQGSTLYVSTSRYNGASTINCYSIDTTTFSSATTLACTGIINSQGIANMYVDGSHIYLAHTTSGTINAYLTKFAKTGGAGTQLLLGSTSKRASCIVPASDGDSLWVLERTTASANNVHQVNHSAMTITQSVALPAGRWDMHYMKRITVNDIDYLLIPAIASTSKSTSGASLKYAQSLLVFNTSTLETSIIPVPNLFNSTIFIRNMVLDTNAGYLYLADGYDDMNGINIVRASLDDFSDVAVGFFPFTTSGITTSDYVQNHVMIPDTDGSPIVLRNTWGNSRGPVNFEWFKPSFSTHS